MMNKDWEGRIKIMSGYGTGNKSCSIVRGFLLVRRKKQEEKNREEEETAEHRNLFQMCCSYDGIFPLPALLIKLASLSSFYCCIILHDFLMTYKSVFQPSQL